MQTLTQWDTADAEIKVHSAENLELSKVLFLFFFFFEPRVDFNIFYFEREKRNTVDNRRTVLLSDDKLTYIKTLRTYKTRSTAEIRRHIFF